MTASSSKLRTRVLLFAAGLALVGVVVAYTASSEHKRSAVKHSAAGHFDSLPTFSSSSVWRSRVDGSVALDSSSQALVGTLVGMVGPEIQGRYGPWINTTSYSVPVYTVGSGQAPVPVTLDRPQPYAVSLKASFGAGVPIPPGAQPAAGNDEHLVVWQPSSDTMWEFWHLHMMSDGWHADWGGTMQHVSQNPGYFTGATSSWGATATSLPLVGGLITPAELQAGVIDHALAIALPQTRAKTWAWPAQRTDGNVTGPDTIPEGARFRLDPTLDLSTLNLPPLTLMLARAAQRYGIVVRDKTGVVTFYAQDPTPTGNNPYPQLFGTKWPSTVLNSFPWSHLQLLKMTLTPYS